MSGPAGAVPPHPGEQDTPGSVHQSVSAGRDAYTAGRDQHFHLPAPMNTPTAVVTTVYPVAEPGSPLGPDTAGDPASAGDEWFVGRGEQTNRILAALAPDTDRQGARPGPARGVVSVIAGMGGIGKTALARHTAGIAVGRRWFPGGAVWADLHGYDDHDHGGQVQPGHVFAPLLRAVGMPAGQIPATPSDQGTLLHRWLDHQAQSGQRVLLVLDNVADTTQIKDLLPQAETHRVLLTSRDTLALPRAWRLELDVLTEDEAVRLARAILNRAHLEGRDPRDAAEPDALAAVVGWCGRLPLAVGIAAAVLASDPDLGIAAYAAELAQRSSRLDSLRHGEQVLGAAFASSWRRLLVRDRVAAKMLCLLTVNPGPDLATDTAAVLAGLPPARASAMLRVLHQAHLVLRERDRWRFHDLVRL